MNASAEDRIQGEYLEAHTCAHCQDIILPGEPVSGKVSWTGPWWGPIEKLFFFDDHFTRLNLSMAALKRKADAGCGFASPLWSRMRQHLDSELDLESVQICITNGDQLCPLLRLSERPSSSRDPASFDTRQGYSAFSNDNLYSGIHNYESPESHDFDRCYITAFSDRKYLWGPYERFFLTVEGADTASESIKTIKPIAADPLSERTIHAIQSWRDECGEKSESTHKLCSLSEQTFVPTRLIEVKSSESKIQLRLVLGADVRTTAYAALSYCWGGRQSMQLSEGNIGTYKTSIPWCDLPATLRDAIKVTYRLGVQYLWIDSMCIIQDGSDDHDKTTQIGQMAKIYTHATFTIMVRRGDSVNDGFLHRRTLPFGTSRLVYDGKFSQHVNLTFNTAVEIDGKPTLDSRGWAMQEYILSRRVIMFGSWLTAWSCRTERHLHTDGWDLNRPSMMRDPFYDSVGMHAEWEFAVDPANQLGKHETNVTEAIMFFSTNPSASTNHWCIQPPDSFIADRWRWIVVVYTSRSFTVAKDRAVAISGLAERFAPFISKGQRYIAGLWESNMPQALLWENYEGTLSDRPTEYQGPSWSWVSTKGAVIARIRCSCPVKIRSIKYVLANPLAQFGAVTSASLSIEGHALSVDWKAPKDTTNSSSLNVGEFRCCIPSIEGTEYFDPKLTGTLDAREDCADWQEVVLLSFNFDDDSEVNGIMLVSEKGDSQSDSEQSEKRLYRRLGCWKAMVRYNGSETIKERWSRSIAPIPPPDEWPVKEFTVV